MQDSAASTTLASPQPRPKHSNLWQSFFLPFYHFVAVCLPGKDLIFNPQQSLCHITIPTLQVLCLFVFTSFFVFHSFLSPLQEAKILNGPLPGVFQVLCPITVFLFQIEFVKGQRPFLIPKARKNQQEVWECCKTLAGHWQSPGDGPGSEPPIISDFSLKLVIFC